MKGWLKHCLAALSVMSCLTASAQIEWLEKNYNYGAFKEAEGPRSGRVRFINTGNEPVFINRVRASCGCTQTEFTEGMIVPGDTAVVGFTYNPKGRPGSFEKTVKVFIGKENELHVIKLSGTVIGAPNTLAFSYPKEAGPLRLEALSAKTGEMKKGSSRHLFINAYNQSADTITPSWECGDRGVQVELTPRAIPPGDIATFGFYVRTSEEERMGPVDYRIKIMADSRFPEKGNAGVTVSTVIVPDTQTMTAEEVNNGPRAYLVPEFIDFGEVSGGKKLDFTFDILNDGNSPLEVMRVYSSEKCVKVKDKPGKIKPGKKGRVKGVIDIGNLPDGAFRIPVEVMTGDPLHPLRTANLVGTKEGE